MEFDNLLKLMIGPAFECLTNLIFQNKTLRDLRVLRGKKRLTAKDTKGREVDNDGI